MDLTFQTLFRLALACKRKPEPPKITHISRAYWLGPGPGRGSLVPPACAFQLASHRRWLLEEPTRSAPPLISLPQSTHQNRRSLLLLQSHHIPQVFWVPQDLLRKQTGQVGRLLDLFVGPYLATRVRLADLSLLNHSTSASIVISSACTVNSSRFAVGIGVQRATPSKIAPTLVCLDLNWDNSAPAAVRLEPGIWLL